MFKNMLKRAWLSTSRKLSRTVILGLVLFAMANLVLAAIAIRGAVNESMDYAKSSLGGTVYLQADMEKMRSEMETQFQGGEISAGERVGFERPGVTADVADAIAESDYVKDFTYGLDSTANASGFEVVETEETEMREAFHQMSDGSMMNNRTGETAGPAFMERGDVTISGVNSYAFISGVKNGTMSIADGEYFDEDDDDAVMISQDLATQNSFDVGDKIKLEKTADDSKIELTIIGIYDTTEDNQSGNTVYMNIVTAARFLSDEDYDDGKYNVDNVQYFLTSSEYAETFISETKQQFPELEEDGLALSTDTSAYEQMVEPIENVGSFATTILVIVTIASVVIIALIVTINVKDRRYEIGVLLSLGARKLNVVGAVLVELVLVGTVAFGLSIGTSSFLAQSIGSGLLDSQIASSEAQSEQNFGRPGTMTGGGGRGGMGGGMMPSGNQQPNNANVETIDEIDIKASAADYAILFAVGYGVLLLALIIPAVNIMRFEPKTILTGKE
ncbi:MAG: ABC transporter permease [Candidatus Nomurabacteria bacterium]|jgi:putative ABC transport system permease protein|nr:ABC transporter permease [Candidatus Nomurabacteria bacterium]